MRAAQGFRIWFLCRLNYLRQNQAQIVQAEKMSSLGQLVAGVAHEINNPVNFIYGNISYAGEYIQDLTSTWQRKCNYYYRLPQARGLSPLSKCGQTSAVQY